MNNTEALKHFNPAQRDWDPLHPIMRFEATRFDFFGTIPAPVQEFLPHPASMALAGPGFTFGSFRLLLTQRLLLDGTRPIPIGGRAMDLLAVLAEQAGTILSKQELIKQVWPGITVEENNLKVQISALRRALSDRQAGRRFIVTVPGRGYTFVARVTREDASSDRMVANF